MIDSPNQNARQDESTVAAVRGGDVERYRELVERHERRVYAVAWSRLGDAALAEEATQEAFIRAYRRLWLLGDGARFSGWVNMIARRVAINLGLRHRRELNKRERWGLEHLETPKGNGGDENDARHTPETLRQTLMEMPDAQRECLVLFYLEGKSGMEAAAALGISEAALRVRLHRARAVMRERMEAKLEESLRQLQPGKTLAPTVMAGVLASSSAKAAAGTAGIMGMLMKFGPLKWVLALAPGVFLLPAVFFNWLVLRLELANFRDQKGFRARLFRAGLPWQILWLAVMMAGVWLVMSHFHNLDSIKTGYAILGLLGLCLLPFQLRRVMLNRSRYSLAMTAGSSFIFLALLLAGIGLMPLGWCLVAVIIQGCLTVYFQAEQPKRMDYSLFLRGTEGLLKSEEADTLVTPVFTQEELLAFARFLGTRWLVQSYRGQENGLKLQLTPVNASLMRMLYNLPGWTQGSTLWLPASGAVTAQLGRKDRDALQRLQGERLPSDAELQRTVSQAVQWALVKFREGQMAAAERAMGQIPEADVFVKPQARLFSTRMQRAVLIASLIFFVAVEVMLKSIFGFMPSFSLGDLSRQNYRRAMNDLKITKTEEKRFYALDDAAKESFVADKLPEAGNYARELMVLAPGYQGNWNYGNAIQDANLVLGRIAVRTGRIKEAKGYLIAAGKSPGSPQMDSFGPNLTLAQDLLKKGERDTVLEYFMLCRRFWKMDYGKLDEWTREVMAGKTPDFGANLLY